MFVLEWYRLSWTIFYQSTLTGRNDDVSEEMIRESIR